MSVKPDNEFNLSLKLMVDTKAKKVVFAESGKDFVDFIFHLLSLPLATVVKLLKDKGMGGCLGSVYSSFNSLGYEYFEPNIVKASVFSPNIDVIVPRLTLINDTPAEILLYSCSTHNRYSFTYGLTCPVNGCSKTLCGYEARFVTTSSRSANQGFVKATVPYMVMDDLEVKPMSISHLRYHINGFNYLEEKVVQVGVKEGLEILKASLVSNAVLTTVFLGKDN